MEMLASLTGGRRGLFNYMRIGGGERATSTTTS